MIKSEFNTFMVVDTASTSLDIKHLENRIWNYQTFFTDKQWHKIVAHLFEIESVVKPVFVSCHHSELKAVIERQVLNMTTLKLKVSYNQYGTNFDSSMITTLKLWAVSLHADTLFINDDNTVSLYCKDGCICENYAHTIKELYDSFR